MTVACAVLSAVNPIAPEPAIPDLTAPNGNVGVAAGLTVICNVVIIAAVTIAPE